MKLVIQIPCFNEAETLPETLAGIPQTIAGIDAIEILVIDDGSTDGTARIAREHGVHRVVSFPYNQGLAKAFARGLSESEQMGADIVVNTDADNQYPGHCIPDLIAPILIHDADIVVGCRPIESIAHFSPLKKKLQRIGSRMVTWLTGVQIPDVTSGFRAYSRRAIRELKVLSDFTYTIETIIQAAKSGLRMTPVTVAINPPTRPSRLFHSNAYYIRRQASTILRIWALYSPGKLFNGSAMLSLSLGSILLTRFIIHYAIAYP
ncbi:glycosyltransferase family 2 protein, partial [bacterium]|nr:glycosyltransferase family 2 protein [candidate division CSSED10-310 bacterium]